MTASLSWGGQAPPGAVWPRGLKRGDVVGVFAPAHIFNRAEMTRGVRVLHGWGLRAKIPPGIFKSHRYLAGKDEDRLAVMESLMADDEVKALVAVRGGSGCQRLLPWLADKWRQWPAKPIVGFSDLTALHLARFKAAGVIGYHGPMVCSLGREKPADALDGASRNALRRAILAGGGAGEWRLGDRSVLRGGRAAGPLLGGNLTMLNALLPGPYLPDIPGAILMLEDIGEPGYRLDRLLTTLRQSAAWRQAAGLVFGHFTNCGPPRWVRAILKEAAADFQGPVVMNAPFGHGRQNRFFPVGAMATLVAQG